MKWAAGMTVAKREPSFLLDSIESLADSGYERIHIFADVGAEELVRSADHDCHCTPYHLGPFPNFIRCLKWLVENHPDADAYAIFQDDIAVTVGLRPWLDAHLWPKLANEIHDTIHRGNDPPRRVLRTADLTYGGDGTGIGVVSLYTARPNAAGSPGWHLLENNPEQAWGAMGYVFPPESARKFLLAEKLHANQTKTDHWVGLWCAHNNLAYVLHTPSFIKHLGWKDSAIGPIPEDKLEHFNQYRDCREWVADVKDLAGWYAAGVGEQGKESAT